MWLEFQEAVVVVAGDGIFIVAAFAIAGAVLVAMLDVALGVFRRLV
jgi:hypothetical protein